MLKTVLYWTEKAAGQGASGYADEHERSGVGAEQTGQGKEHPHTLTSMKNVALFLGSQGKYEEAEELHRKTLDMRWKVLGK